jgi:hypothetical protein
MQRISHIPIITARISSSSWRKSINLSNQRRHYSSNQSPVLVRDFIYDSLYNPNYGYFNSQEPLIFTNQSATTPLQSTTTTNNTDKTLAPLIDFKSLRDQSDYLDTLHQLYTLNGHSWGTPVEIFQPYFAQSLLNYILMKYDSSKPLIIYEIGGGTGTCALNILSTLSIQYPTIYENTKYHIIEVSSELHKMQQERLKIHGDHIVCHHQSIFDFNNNGIHQDDHVFVIALEVMDNLPHDKVIINGEGDILQAMVVDKGINDRGIPVFEEIEVPLTDPLIYQYLKYTRPDLEGDSDSTPIDTSNFVDLRPKRRLQSWFNRSTSNFREYIVSLTGVGDQVYYIPTMQLLMLQTICSNFPKHDLILADFDYLPRHDLIMYTENAIHNPPIVQRKFEKKTVSRVYNNDAPKEYISSCFSTYLVPKGTCDIFFATDFKELQRVYAQCTHNTRQGSTVMKMSQFAEKFSLDISDTQTKSGYNPALSDYSNFAFFTTD